MFRRLVLLLAALQWLNAPIASGAEEGRPAAVGASHAAASSGAGAVAGDGPSKESPSRAETTPEDVFNTAFQTVNDEYLQRKKLDANWASTWEHKYDGKLRTLADSHKAIRAMLASLQDPSCKLESPSAMCKSTSMWISLLPDETIPTIVGLRHPAYVAGLRKGDKILTVDGVSTDGMSLAAVVKKLSGLEGTVVQIGYQRGKHQGTVKVKNAPPTAVADFQELNRGTIGYIRLDSLALPSTTSEVLSVLTALRGAKSLILDLRDNDGGAVKYVFSLASVFLSNGMIMTILDGDAVPTGMRASGTASDTRPLVILVNGGTARGAEALALALRENGRATIIGSKSKGDGTISEMTKLPDGMELWIPIGQILAPSGQAIQETAVVPNITVEVPDHTKGAYWTNGGSLANATGEIADIQVVKAIEFLSARPK